MALAAAARIAEEEGLASLTARRVASEIGYTVGSLYMVFANLDDLLLHVNGQTLGELHRALREATRDCRVPRNCLLVLGRGYIDFASRHRNRWRLIFEHRLPDNISLPQWYLDRVDRLFLLAESFLAPLLEDPSGRHVKLAARALWGGVHGVCILSLTGKLEATGGISVQVLADSLIDNYLIGLTASARAGG
jgi:AcrR family transcriptional regulator